MVAKTKVQINYICGYFLIICLLSFTNIQTAIGQGHMHVYTVYFKKNCFDIENKYEPVLKGLAKKLNADSCRMIKIYGYTDTSGSKEYNDALSEKRVNSVLNYLLSCNKFDTSKVYMEWLGEADDAYDLHLPNAHILQRSVDIWVLFNNKHSP